MNENHLADKASEEIAEVNWFMLPKNTYIRNFKVQLVAEHANLPDTPSLIIL